MSGHLNQGHSFKSIFSRFIKETVYKSAAVATILTIALFPTYLQIVKYLTNSPINGSPISGECQQSNSSAFTTSRSCPSSDYAEVGLGYSPAFAYAVISSFVHTIVYVMSNGFFGYLDTSNALQHYKLWRKPEFVEQNKKLHFGTLLNAGISQLIVNPVMVYYLFPTFQKMGMGNLTDSLPGWKSLMVSYCICHSFNEFFFYWTHRAFHTPMLYKLFHKQHHEYKGTIGIAAEHAHPVEAIVANMIPTLGGCFVVRNHPIVLVIWLACRLRETFEAHSGYCFKGSWYAMTGLSHDDEAIHHDYHHAINDGNFGSELTDFLFGTLHNFDKFGGQKEYLNRKKVFEAASINEEPSVAVIASSETSKTSETVVTAKKMVRKAKSPSAKAKSSSSAKKEGAK